MKALGIATVLVAAGGILGTLGLAWSLGVDNVRRWLCQWAANHAQSVALLNLFF